VLWHGVCEWIGAQAPHRQGISVVHTLARALGWFSIGLGALQLIVPGRLLRVIGVQPTAGRRGLTRLIGLREVSVAPGLLAASAPVGWLGARVAGDLMDLVLLVRALGDRSADRRRIRIAMAAVGGVVALDATTTVLARRTARERSRHGGRIVSAITVHAPPADVYAFWRQFENLPRVMPHLERVESRGEGLTHWVTRAPFRGTVEWDAEIVEDRPGEQITWRSIEGSGVRNAGSVRFRPAPRDLGTEITLDMEVDVPGGPLGTVVAALGGEDPEQQVSDALRRLKQVLETGEPIVSDATSSGHKVFQRPAQPSEDDAPNRAVSVHIGEPAGVG
jgi:uncharacterized membrane protein